MTLKEQLFAYIQKIGVETPIKGNHLYDMYCIVENFHGRSPVTKPIWKDCFAMYWYYIWSFVIRCGQTHIMRYGLGTIRMICWNQDRYSYHLQWKKPKNRRIKNQTGYSFNPARNDINYGELAKRAYIKECKLANDIKGVDGFYS